MVEHLPSQAQESALGRRVASVKWSPLKTPESPTTLRWWKAAAVGLGWGSMGFYPVREITPCLFRCLRDDGSCNFLRWETALRSPPRPMDNPGTSGTQSQVL